MNNLRDLRKKSGLTQIQLCEALNISQATLWGYETGAHEPDLSTLIKIADYFGVSVDCLLGRKENTIPELSDEESELLALFGKMSHAQKARFVGYGEGLLNERKEMADKAFK